MKEKKTTSKRERDLEKGRERARKTRERELIMEKEWLDNRDRNI